MRFSVPFRMFTSMVRFSVFAPFVLAMLTNSIQAGDSAESIAVLPKQITLTGPLARQRLLVQRVRADQMGEQIAEGIELRSSDPKVVRVEHGNAVSAGNGSAVITAKSGKLVAKVDVVVRDFDVPHQWSFRNHVQSVFAKTGCNSGACHGAAAGKKGFKLSLRGYDPEADFRTITRQSRGRRIVPSDPGRSLLLTKPTGAVLHKGGLRFDVNSHEYRVVSEWVANGHPGPSNDDPRLQRVEVLPHQTMLQRGATQQLVVRAHFTDGHVEDVTRWAKYTSSNLSVAQVDGQGRVEVSGNGEASIVAWYLAQNVIATVSVPYETKLPPEIFANSERSNLIDELVLDKLKSLNLPPSPQATDAQFMRRAFVDTIGLLPSADEARAFLADQSQDKRDRLVDRLLGRPEFVDYWAYKWSDLLLVTGARLKPKAVESYYNWVRKQVEKNTPWDEFARGVVTARGSTLENGAANFFALHEDPLGMAETVSMAFLGMSINCARCHDHPLEKWTNDDYYGMASLFARVRGKGWGGDAGSGDGNRSIFSADSGELIQPRTGNPQQPRPLDGDSIPYEATGDRRIPLANWLTARENPYFSRAIVNRVWANFLGVGIVEKVDDLRLTNPPSNETLFAGLADYLVDNKYDLKALMQLILNSKTYQRSSHSISGNEDDTRYYSRFYPRRLKAEILLDIISQVSGAPSKFKDYPDGTRALQLRDANVESRFLKTFGRPERIITCNCERSDDPTMIQVLHIVNGDTLNEKLSRKGNRVDKLLSAGIPDYRIVEDLYLILLSKQSVHS